MRHFASTSFWDAYRNLPADVRNRADRAFRLLKANPSHPALHFKKVGRFRSVRVGRRYRALAVEEGDDLHWFWIGSHADYDNLLAQSR